MSIGVTAIEPSPIEGTYAPSDVFRSVRTPSLYAICATFSGPTSSVSRAYTVLSERRVPRSIDVAPMYEWSNVCTHHAVGGLVLHEPRPVGLYSKGAERYVVEGLIPSEIAVASTSVLNVDPGCRCALERKLTWFFLLPGVTSVIARIAPFTGLIEMIAAAGSVE